VDDRDGQTAARADGDLLGEAERDEEKPDCRRQFMSDKTQRLVRRTVRIFASCLAGIFIALSAWGAEPAVTIPPPTVDETVAPNAALEVTVLAGGCFWGVQGVFQHVKGVTSAISGYTGGASDTADYEIVSEGKSGHAESVKITFDPREVTFGRLLQVFFSVVHDPTELNRQGPDTGTQYRSAIFPTSDAQRRIASAYIEQLSAAHAFHSKIVTTIEPDRTFYPAEDYHQDFLTRHPTYPYIVINDLPKIENLRRKFAALYRAKPVLVSEASASR
jgi:peptide-methionine (S)-S-oxide reductase